MLYDEHFADRVYADPSQTLDGLDLTGDEIDWLVVPDRRRWKADPLRAARALHGLFAEYPVSVAALSTEHHPNALLEFFHSSHFHQCIMNMGSLSVCFGEWLVEARSRLAGLARLEKCIAQRRRLIPHDCYADAHWGLDTQIDVLMVPKGTLDYFESTRSILPQDPAELTAFLMDGSVGDGEKPNWNPHEDEGIIIDVSPDGGVGTGSHELVQFLSSVRTGLSQQEAINELCLLGADAHEAPELLDSFRSDGLIIRV